MRVLFSILVLLTASCSDTGRVTEFCLVGELDLGARMQGTSPGAGEFYPTTWCVMTEDTSMRAMFAATGNSNPDSDGSWVVAYLPPDEVRIVNRETPPDIRFAGADSLEEAKRVRRIDPRHLIQEYREAAGSPDGLDVEIRDGRVHAVTTHADLPLRGRVEVIWRWDWTLPEEPSLELIVDDAVLFRATGRWRRLPNDEAAALWEPTPGADPVVLPGEYWPARSNMRLVELADGVYLVQGVRTGFQHLVVDTDEGLVVGDAPAGWVELHQIPPVDLVPGYGISGLSESLVDFFSEALKDRPVRAVALTHFHDDHAGGARAFAAAGAEIFAPKESSAFLATALNRSSMPADRLGERGVTLTAVGEPVVIGSEPARVKLVPLGPGPHVDAMLGVWAVDHDYFFVSDVHVPATDAAAPRAARARTECWFARWAAANLPPEVRVVNSHSDTIMPVSKIAQYLESDLCDKR